MNTLLKSKNAGPGPQEPALVGPGFRRDDSPVDYQIRTR